MLSSPWLLLLLLLLLLFFQIVDMAYTFQEGIHDIRILGFKEGVFAIAHGCCCCCCCCCCYCYCYCYCCCYCYCFFKALYQIEGRRTIDHHSSCLLGDKSSSRAKRREIEIELQWGFFLLLQLLQLLLLLLLLLYIVIVTVFSNRRHVRAGHARWFEKTKPGELKNKRAYQMLIWKISSR
jgi:hypothetical protein